MDVVERDPAKMGQVKKAVLDLVVIGDLLKRCRKVVDVVEGEPAKMEQVKKAVLERVVIGYLTSRIVLQSM